MKFSVKTIAINVGCIMFGVFVGLVLSDTVVATVIDSRVIMFMAGTITQEVISRLSA